MFSPRFNWFTSALVGLGGPGISLAAVAGVNAGTEITITAATSGDISAGVFGVEYNINSAPPPYAFSVNVVGAVSSQSITIGALEGIVVGDTVYLRAYYNRDPLDPVDTRVYGTPTLTVTITGQYMLPGAGYVNSVGTGQFMLPGVGYVDL